MPLVVGVAFKPVTKVYYFDPSGIVDLSVDERVVVDTARGRTLGTVVFAPVQVPATEISGTLKPVLRRATALDMVQQDQAAHSESEALAVCQQKAAALKLPMKIVRVEYNFDGSSVLVYFTSDTRIDFRSLVHELAQVMHSRVEMRQIGVRDEAKFLGGFGRCGRELCCASWLREFTPVSIKMAKQQDLPLNPTEISGVCGRLLCCLSYENDFYGELRSKLPRLNSTIDTPEGPGKVKQVHVMRNTVTVQVPGPNETKTYVDVVLGEVVFDEPPAPDGCVGCGRRPVISSSDVLEAASPAGESGEGEEDRPAESGGAASKDTTAKSGGSRKRDRARRNRSGGGQPPTPGA
jgi:cell fate regulator YaaT (PSP1 superfamily)